MVTNFTVKICKIGVFLFILSPGISKRIVYRHSDFKTFIYDDLATLCVNLVNFGPVTLEFTKVKDVHQSFLSLK